MTSTKKIKKAAGLCFFNSAKELLRCLPTLKDFDVVICIDGKYKGFDWPWDLSSDGSREIINSFPNTIILDAPNLPEFQKRQVYFDYCAAAGDIDYLLIIDSDEYIQGDMQAFNWWLENIAVLYKPSKIMAYKMPVGDHLKPDWYRFMTRLFVQPGRFEYRKLHWAIALKDDPIGQYVDSKRCGYSAGIHLSHDHTLRDQDYIARREKFQNTQKEYEMNVNLMTLEHEVEAIERIKKEMSRAGIR